MQESKPQKIRRYILARQRRPPADRNALVLRHPWIYRGSIDPANIPFFNALAIISDALIIGVIRTIMLSVGVGRLLYK